MGGGKARGRGTCLTFIAVTQTKVGNGKIRVCWEKGGDSIDDGAV